MRVVGRGVLDEYTARHADLRDEVASWIAEARKAQWTKPLDIRRFYPSVSFVNDHVIFNLKGNHYRLDTIVAYETKIVLVKRIGTHAEYDRWDF